LPPELLPFAENFYRRFPEEFVALGAPGLEQIFDLRIEGTRSRRISDNPTEKTVEITIRRWQPPFPQQPPFSSPYPSCYGSFPQQGPYTGLSSPPTAFPGPYSCPPPQPSQQRHAPAPSSAEGQMASQLARLETALAVMLPQVEAAMRQSQQSQQQGNFVTTNHNKPAPGVTFGGEQVGGGTPAGGATPTTGAPASPLRERRNMANMSIQPPVRMELRPTAPPAPRVEEPAAVVPESSVKPAAADNVRQQSPKTKPEKPRINPVRMLPNSNDPESPRSPGRYSAWN